MLLFLLSSNFYYLMKKKSVEYKIVFLFSSLGWRGLNPDKLTYEVMNHINWISCTLSDYSIMPVVIVAACCYVCFFHSSGCNCH